MSPRKAMLYGFLQGKPEGFIPNTRGHFLLSTSKKRGQKTYQGKLKGHFRSIRFGQVRVIKGNRSMKKRTGIETSVRIKGLVLSPNFTKPPFVQSWRWIGSPKRKVFLTSNRVGWPKSADMLFASMLHIQVTKVHIENSGSHKETLRWSAAMIGGRLIS